MPRKFTPKRIRNVRSSKATVRRPKSMMGKGTNITGLDTESLRQRIDTIETPVKASSQAVGDALSGLIPPFQIDDSVIPATNYERSGTYYSPNFTGQETTYVEMQSDEMTRLPRKWRNALNQTLMKNMAAWTNGSDTTLRYSKETGIYTATGVASSATGNAIRTPDAFSGEDMEGRELTAGIWLWADTPAEVGNTVVFRVKRSSGGTDTGKDLTWTLTAEPTFVTTGTWTGLASNTGAVITFVNTGTADRFQFKKPILCEVTNLTNKTIPGDDQGDDSKRELITNGTFSSDPEIPYARLKGQAGSGFSMPSDNLVAHLSDDNTYLRIAARVNVDWNPASNGNIWSLYDFGANDRVINLVVLTSGNLAAYVSADGLFVNDATNRFYGPSVSDFEDKFYWVEFTFDGGTGTFRTSSQQVDTYEEVSRWSAESTSTLPTTSLYAGATADIVVGANQNSGVFVSPLNGKIARAEVMSRSGELVNVFDAGDWDSNYYLDADHNMITPAARHDIANEWTQTGTGSVTPVSSGKQELNSYPGYPFTVTTGYYETIDARADLSVSGEALRFQKLITGWVSMRSSGYTVMRGNWYLISVDVDCSNFGSGSLRLRSYNGTTSANTGPVISAGTARATYTYLVQADSDQLNFDAQAETNSSTAYADFYGISIQPFALDGRTGYGQNTVLNAVKAPVNDSKRFIEPDKNTEANALNPSRDANATTGWGTGGLDGGNNLTITTVETNNSSHAFYINSNANPSSANRVSKDLITDFGLVEGKVYQIQFDWKHKGGGGDWTFYLSSTEGGRTLEVATITNADTTYQTETILYAPDLATNSWGVFRENNAGNGGQIYVDNFSIKEVDPNYWFRNDGAPSQGANGKLLLSADSGADEQLQRPLDLSSYAAGDVLTVSLVTEAQTHDVTLSLTQADQTTSQADFTSTAAGRRVWYHVLTQADIDDTSFLSLGATGDAAATATVLDVSIRKFTGCFTVLEDSDADLDEARFTYSAAIPTNNQAYAVQLKLSQGSAAKTGFEFKPLGVSTVDNSYEYVWETNTLTTISEGSANVTVSATIDVNGLLTIDWQGEDTASNTSFNVRIDPASNDAAVTGTANLHSVSLTGANWVPNGNIAMNTDDWEPNSDALIGIYDDELILINTKASVSQAYQEVACRRYVEHTVATDNAGTKRIKFGSSINGTQYADWGSTSGFRSGTITPTAASKFYLTFDSNSGALGNRSRFRLATAQESSYGLGTSKYMNNALALGGEVTYDSQHWFENDNSAGSYCSIDATSGAKTTGTLTFTVVASKDDWASGVTDTFRGKFTATADRCYLLSARGTGTLLLTTSPDGTSGNQVQSESASHGMTPGRHVITVTLNLDDDTATFAVDGVTISENVPHVSGGIFAGTNQTAEVGSIFLGTLDALDGKIFSATVVDENGNDFDPPFYAETAIADGWSVNSVGNAQIKNNALIPLHRYEDEQLHDDYAVVQVPGRYKHFITSEALGVGNARLPSLANANHPNGGGIYADVAALPNLIDPASRVDFSAWTKTGSGSHTPQGDGDELAESHYRGGPYTQADIDAMTEANISTSLSDGVAVFTGSSGSASIARVTNLVDESTLIDGEWYVWAIEMGADNTPSASVFLRGRNSDAYKIGGALSANTVNYRLIRHNSVDYTGYELKSFMDSAASFEIKSISLQRYSYTTLSDEDDTADETYWLHDVTIPNDGEVYKLPIKLSQGTAAETAILLQFRNGVNKSVRYIYDWSAGAFTQETDDTATAVVSATANADGTVDLSIQAQDTGANTLARILIQPAGRDASTQGTVNVHGDVVLQRISAAAEPTWNTLRPKDSVKQWLLQQGDLTTTWTNLSSPTVASYKDPAGGTQGFSIQDNNSTNFEAKEQEIDFAATAGETINAGLFYMKRTGLNCYPGFGIRDADASTNYLVMVDPINGKAIAETASGALTVEVVDGASLPITDLYPGVADFWYVRMSFAAVSANNYVFRVYAAAAETFGSTWATSAQGTSYAAFPAAWIGDDNFFWDSLATTATVTEEIQDWSKIFTFATEGDGAQVTQVFTHGHHQLLGAENVTGLTNEVSTPFHVASSEASWVLSNSFTSQTDVGSVIPAESAVEFTADGTDGYVQQNSGNLTSSKETMLCIFSTPPEFSSIELRLVDNVGSRNVGVTYSASTGLGSTAGTGTSRNAGVIPLGVFSGNNLYCLYVQCVPASNDPRGIRVYPNGRTTVSGEKSIIHYVGHVESDIVSILPLEGTRTAHSRWEYDIANLSDEAGTLQTDLIFTLDRADAGNADDEIVGQNGNVSLLRLNGSKYLSGYDGTYGTGVLDTVIQNAQDATRTAVSWSSTENEFSINGNNDLGTETEVGANFGSFSELAEIDVYPDGNAESFMPSMTLTKKYSDATERASAVEYHRDD